MYLKPKNIELLCKQGDTRHYLSRAEHQVDPAALEVRPEPVAVLFCPRRAGGVPAQVSPLLVQICQHVLDLGMPPVLDQAEGDSELNCHGSFC